MSAAGARPRGAERLVIALDLPGLEPALDLVARLPREVRWVKVGLELFAAAGPAAVTVLRERGFQVFLDLKLHDIPHTVARAAAAATRLGAGMLTVHCDAGLEALRAARAACEEAAASLGVPPPGLVGVTVLTSWSEQAYREQTGWPGSLGEAVLHRARLAARAGLLGVVCAPADVPLLRGQPDPGLRELALVCPGIRPAGAAGDDQARVAGAAEAVRAGADWLVVGRPVTRAPDPAAAVRALLAEIAAGEGESGRGDGPGR